MPLLSLIPDSNRSRSEFSQKGAMSKAGKRGSSRPNSSSRVDKLQRNLVKKICAF